MQMKYQGDNGNLSNNYQVIWMFKIPVGSSFYQGHIGDMVNTGVPKFSQ
jgi:hypothetical protein